MSELHSDLRLHDEGVFPEPIQLPQITAAEYCKVRTALSEHSAVLCTICKQKARALVAVMHTTAAPFLIGDAAVLPF